MFLVAKIKNMHNNDKREKVVKNIIIVDMQKGFINQNNSDIVEPIINYLKSNNFDNVFYTRFINTIGGPFVKFLGYNAMSTKEECEFVVDVVKSATIFNKTGYGLSFEMINELKNRNIKEIEICGTDIDACILAVAFDLFDNGIRPIILENLCGTSSSNKEIHKCAITLIDRQFGKNNIKTV